VNRARVAGLVSVLAIAALWTIARTERTSRARIDRDAPAAPPRGTPGPSPAPPPAPAAAGDVTPAPTTATLHVEGDTVRSTPTVAWAEPDREPSTDSAFDPAHERPRRLVSADGRFDLGTILEDSSGRANERHLRLRADGSSGVRIVLRGDPDATDLRAVVVQLPTLLSVVTLPDGGRADGAELDEAYCNAAPRSEGPPVVNVAVDVPGFRPLRFEYDPRDPPASAIPTTEPAPPPR
jgi:hypothetical protein